MSYLRSHLNYYNDNPSTFLFHVGSKNFESTSLPQYIRAMKTLILESPYSLNNSRENRQKTTMTVVVVLFFVRFTFFRTFSVVDTNVRDTGMYLESKVSVSRVLFYFLQYFVLYTILLHILPCNIKLLFTRLNSTTMT